MSIKNLDILFNPKRIAVIGASENDKSAGYHLLKNLIGKGFKGIVHPVHSTVHGLQGVEAYKSIGDIPTQSILSWWRQNRKICRRF